MSLIKNNTGKNAASVDQFFNNLFNNNLTNFIGADSNQTQPFVNIIETENNYRIEVAAPGLSKKLFDINIEDDTLTLSAKKEEVKEEKEEEVKKKYTRREFNYSSFKRSFTLPDTVDNQGISANYKNGMLTLNLPKKEDAKPIPARKIEIG